MKTIVTLMLLTCSFFLQAQNTWQGNTNSDWNTPTNWSLNTIPNSTENIIINASSNNPVIMAGTNILIKKLVLSGNTILTISSGASLTVNGATNHGIIIPDNSQLYNNGTLKIDNISGAQNQGTSNGISMCGDLINNGIIEINQNGGGIAGRGILAGLGCASPPLIDNQSGEMTIGTGGPTTIELVGSASGVNGSCAILNVTKRIRTTQSATFQNDGFLWYGQNPTGNAISPFLNNGVVEDPNGVLPGSVTNNAINIKPISSDYGVFNNALKIGSSNNFTPSNQWFKDESLSMPAGNYDAVTNTFTATDLEVGQQTLYFNISDDINECSKIVSINVTLNCDTPDASCQNISINLNPDGNAFITPQQIDNGSTVTCGSPLLSLSLSSFTCSDIGENSITLTVEDENGETASCNANLTVNDNTPPQITCPENITVNNDLGLCTATVIYTTPVGTDNCTPTTMQMQGIASGNDFPVGITTNTFEVSDGTQMTDCSFTVTVNDTEVPVFTFCPSDIIQNTDANSCEAVVNFNDPVVTDNCTIGIQGMLETNYDSNNGQRGVMFDVTVVSALNIQKFDANLYAGTTANYEIYYKAGSYQGAENNSGAWTFVGGANAITSLGNNVPTPLPITVDVTIPAGETYAFYITNDFGGGTSYTDISSATKLLASNIDLTITGGVGKSYPFGLSFNYRAFNGTIHYGSELSLTLTQTQGPTSGSSFTVGTSPVSFQATDSYGNMADCSFDVIINDNENPVASCQNIDVQLDANGSTTLTAAQIDNGSSDNCSVDVSIPPTTFDCDNLGANNVTLTATDNDNNTHTCVAIVTIKNDNNPCCAAPVANCQAFTAFVNDSGNTTITETDVDNNSMADCGLQSLVIDNYTFDCSDIGTAQTVTLTITDVNNDSDNCSATVTVLDNILPEISCPSNIMVNNDLDQCGAIINFTEPVGTDNCPSPMTNLTSALGNDDLFPVGISTVSYEVTDASNQTASCDFTVTVNDNQAPAISCPANIMVNNDFDQCGATVNFTEPIGTDNCPSPMTNLTSDLGNGDLFPVGTSTVSYEITDGSSQTATCDFTITVNDNQAPDLICPADITVDCGGSTDPEDTGMASATDNCEEGLPVTYMDETLPAEEGYIIKRTWMTEDPFGNPSTCMQTITIDVCEYQPTDPCVCLNNASVIDLDAGTGGKDGQFSELVAITGPGGGPIVDATLVFEVIAITGGVDAFAPAPVEPTQTVGTPIPVGTQLVYNPTTMHYELPFYHYEDIGYSITVQQIVGGVPGQILGPIGNVCDYPNPVFDPSLEDLYCPDAAAFTLGANELNGNDADAVSYTIDGMTVTELAPASLALGTHTVLMTFDGAAVTNNGSGTLANPNIPGCIQQVQKVIEVNDTEPPVITCTADITVQCDASALPANTGMATATDNCNTTPVITFADVSTQGQGCSAYSYTIIRTWTVTDATNNFSTCSQTITVEDMTPPSITCPADVTVECDQATNPGATGNATATGDNCALDSELIISFSDESTQATAGCGNDNYIITRTWTATDPCGNIATCDQIITVEDTTPPTIICTANATIECDEDTSPTNTGMATGLDNCSAPDEVVITFADVSTQGAAGCTQYMYTISRTWTATDACGNFSNCVQTINVEDTTPPAITCPADITIECDEDTSPVNTGMATGMDNCSALAEIVITSTDISTQGLIGCAKYQYTITRTWTATDACGNFSTCVQTITVDDTTGPMLTCPVNENLDCLSGPIPVANTIDEFLALGGTAVDNCSTPDEWTIEFGDSPGSRDLLNYCSADPADRTVTREYRITDACGNRSTCTQTFTFSQSVTGPVITEIPLDKTITCAAEAIPELAAFNADIDCGLGSTKTVEALPVIGSANCPGARYQFRYTVEDACGRMASHTQTYTIQNDPFEYICPAITCEIDCDATAAEAIAAFDAYTQNAIFVTSCNNLDPVVSYNFNPASLGECGSQTTVNFTATDPCGRSASCASTIVVVDNEAPVISGSISSTFRNCGAFANSDYQSWGQDAMGSVEIDNNCDNTITWSFSPTSPNTENCGTGGISTTIVTFTASDNCGNASTTTAKFFLKDGPLSNLNMTVSGHLRTENDDMVELVEVKASGSDLEDEMSTGDDGYYEFELPSENNYSVTPTRNDHPLNGISTIDLILISQHVLGIQSLDSPYKLIAADINNSGDVTALDMIALRKMILLIDETFENNTSWRFVDANYIFANPNNPFASTFPEQYNINDLIENTIADFIAIKTGDVNGSAIPNQLVSGDTREGLEDLVFQVADQQLQSEESYTVDFKAKDFTEMLGYQFTLSFDTDQLELVNWTSGELTNLDVNNFGTRLHEGVLTSSWNVQNGLSLPDDAVLFSLTFKAKANVKLSQTLNLSSRYTTAEAYSQSASLMNLTLAFNTDNKIDEPTFALYQNQPNPFKSNTTIGFSLPESGEATLTIYDVSGRVLQVIQKDFVKGYNDVNIHQNTLDGFGIFYYRLETSNHTATKKMINVK